MNWRRATRSVCTAGTERGSAVEWLVRKQNYKVRRFILRHTLLMLLASLCIWRHWPRYIKLSLIFPASARVAPWVLASLALSLPAKSTILKVLLPQWELERPRRLFLTSTQKKPWLREETLLLPVPATRLSWRPASSTNNASLRLLQMIFRRPATTLRSGESSVDLKSRGRRRYSLVAFDLTGGVRRSNIRSLYTSYMEMRMAYSADGSHELRIELISGT